DQWGFCNNPHTFPILAFNHQDPGSLGWIGGCISGLAVYHGKSYPPVYRNALFFTDFDENWMKVATLDSNGQVKDIIHFGDLLRRPVDLETDPFRGDLVYVNIQGSIFRVRYLATVESPSVRKTR